MRTVVRPLDSKDALSTYALARLDDPGLTLETWRRRLGRPCEEGGAFASFRARTPHALLTYEMAEGAQGSRLFVIRTVAAFDLTDPSSVAARLVDAVRLHELASGRTIAWAPGETGRAGLLRAIAEGGALHSVF